MQRSAIWMVVAETILFALAARDRPQALETLEEMNQLRSQMTSE